MTRHDVIIENFTSPAARSPYAGTNASVHTIGFTSVIQVTIWKHIFALAGSMPPRTVTGLVNANTSRQLTMIATSAITLNFLCNRPPRLFCPLPYTDLQLSSTLRQLRLPPFHSDSPEYLSLPGLRLQLYLMLIR